MKSFNQSITVKELIKKLQENSVKTTLLGIGPVSELSVRAAMELASDHNFPPIFIASRNQVDKDDFGGGYLMGGMDQKSFVDLLEKEQKAARYSGPIYICRDHGGPWQRNTELDEAYPVERAMDIAKESFQADIEAGFNYLHIDPTKCPHNFSQEDLCNWTVELERFCEEKRKLLNLPDIDYEVGAEDIQGGLTTKEAFDAFLKLLRSQLQKEGLPLPTCIVGQTGTLVKLDRNVGTFDREITKDLIEIAAGYDIGFKEHNGDYLSAASCRVHPEMKITAMNVAPEFGVVETNALLYLSDLEDRLLREGWISRSEYSNFRELLFEATFNHSPWRKWMTPDIKKIPREEIEINQAIRELIAKSCGHYTYDRDEIKTAREKLGSNIDKYRLLDVPAHDFVLEKVKESIYFYIRHFNLDGINKWIM